MKKLICTTIALLMATVFTQAEVTTSYFDDEFNDSDWQMLLVPVGLGGSISSDHVSSGGNPGAYRQINNVVNPAPAGPDVSAIFGFHGKVGADYDMATMGVINAIDFSIDYKSIYSSFGGQAFGITIKQDDVYYVQRQYTYAVFNWQTSLNTGLLASDFSELLFDSENLALDYNSNPDFSASGSLISFGFYTANSTGTSSSSPQPKTIAYDNWSVVVNPVPEPASFLLLTSSLPLFLRRLKNN